MKNRKREIEKIMERNGLAGWFEAFIQAKSEHDEHYKLVFKEETLTAQGFEEMSELEKELEFIADDLENKLAAGEKNEYREALKQLRNLDIS